MQKWIIAGVALALLVGSTELTAKGLRRGGNGCGTPDCGVRYQYVTEYVTVNRQVCTYEPVTTEQEVTEIECKEIRTPKKEKVTYYENELRKKKEKVTTYKMVTEKQTQKYMVCEPVTTEEEKTFTTATPKYTTTKQTGTRYMPQTKTMTKTVPVTTYSMVPVHGCQTVAVSSGCTSRPGCCRKPCDNGCVTYATVPTVSYQCVPTTTHVTQTYNVCEYVPQTYTYDVTTVSYEYSTEKRKVPVTRYQMVEKSKEVMVQVCRPVTEEVEVTYYECVKKEKEVDVVVVTYQNVEKKVKRPVTTYKPVIKTVTETVPVTRCVPVYSTPTNGCGSTAVAPGCCH